MVLGDTAEATCVRISSLDVVRAATVARTIRRSRLCSDKAAIHNLNYGCGSVPQTTKVYIDLVDHC